MKLSKNDSMMAVGLEENTALDDKGELIGLEIIGASEFLRDTIVESAQAKLPGVPHVESA